MMRLMLMLVVMLVVENLMGVWAGAKRIPSGIRNCSSTIAQFLEKKNYKEIISTEIMFTAIILS